MKITNNIITIEVAEHGAEMTSLSKDGREYLWTGDARFWNRHAPILFPAVGKPFNNEIHVNGVAYPLHQHGYARDSQFEVLASDNDHELRLRMLENESSQGYPYRLGLEVSYRLEGNVVEVVWTVENLDNKEAYFQIGGHPGFLLPDYDPESMVNGYIRFYNKDGELVAPTLTSNIDDGCRVPRSSKVVLLSETPLMQDTFLHDALIIEEGQVTKVELRDRHGNPVLNVDCPQADAYGIWAPHKEGCPFVCLEPWCGICDSKGFTDDISKRTYIHSLAPGEKYSFTYTIEVY
jgi:galactose mutarotase-like enzyme